MRLLKSPNPRYFPLQWTRSGRPRRPHRFERSSGSSSSSSSRSPSSPAFSPCWRSSRRWSRRRSRWWCSDRRRLSREPLRLPSCSLRGRICRLILYGTRFFRTLRRGITQFIFIRSLGLFLMRRPRGRTTFLGGRSRGAYRCLMECLLGIWNLMDG